MIALGTDFNPLDLLGVVYFNELFIASLDILGELLRLFLWKPSFEGNHVSLMGFSLTSKAGIDGITPTRLRSYRLKPWPILGYKQTSYLLGWFNPNTT